MRATVRLSHRSCRVSAFVLAVVLCATAVFSTSAASASMVGFPGLGVRINAHGQGPAVDHNPPGQLRAQEHWPAPDRPVWSYEGSHKHGNSWQVEYSIEADPDPYLYATFTLSNFTSSPMDFTLDANLSISPQIIGGFLAGGSISGTLVDLVSGNSTGASLSSITGTPIYMSRIDGANFQPLMLDPQSFTTGDGETSSFGPEHFGTPIPSLASSGDILSSMEIEINATVGPHSIAVIVATFEAQVPEPASFALVSIGLGILALRRRRRR